jgi:signal peptidase II
VRKQKKSAVRLKRFVLLIIGILVLDQLTKAIFRGISANIPVFKFFSIALTTNTGSAFGLFQGANSILVFLSLIVIGLGVLFYEKLLAEREYWCYALIGAGVIGNLIDRAFFGRVTDFLAFSFWPTFNIADSAISIGIVALLVYWILDISRK